MDQQLTVLRSFSGEKRLKIALRLNKLVRELALANIKSLHPRAGKKQLARFLVQRYAYGRN